MIEVLTLFLETLSRGFLFFCFLIIAIGLLYELFWNVKLKLS